MQHPAPQFNDITALKCSPNSGLGSRRSRNFRTQFVLRRNLRGVPPPFDRRTPGTAGPSSTVFIEENRKRDTDQKCCELRLVVAEQLYASLRIPVIGVPSQPARSLVFAADRQRRAGNHRYAVRHHQFDIGVRALDSDPLKRGRTGTADKLQQVPIGEMIREIGQEWRH